MSTIELSKSNRFFFSVDEDEVQTELSALQCYTAAINILIFCISLPGNCFLLWFLQREKAWKTTPDILLLQLTVSNLCFTLNLPFEACNQLHGWIFGEWACRIKTGVYFLGLNTSEVILAAMALHYYVSTGQVSCVCARVSRKCCVLVASILIWLVCVAASIKLSVSCKVTFEQMCLRVASITELLVELIMEIVLFFLISFFIITFCYVRMWILVKQGRINDNQQPSKLILWMTFCTFLCLILHYVIIVIMMVETMLYIGHAWRHEFYFVGSILYPLSHFYCCISPLCYIIGAQRFRKYLPILCNRLSQSRDMSNNESPVRFIPLQKDEEMCI